MVLEHAKEHPVTMGGSLFGGRQDRLQRTDAA
jgi:hypothetical protein